MPAYIPRKKRRYIPSAGSPDVYGGELKNLIGSVLLPILDRNNSNECVGSRFTLGVKNIKIVQLGVFKTAGNNQTHTVKIVDNAGTILVSASIDFTPLPDTTFTYVNVTPTLLLAGNTYNIVVSEISGGDHFADSALGNVTPTSQSIQDQITITNAVFQTACAGAVATTFGANSSYGYVDFKYMVI